MNIFVLSFVYLFMLSCSGQVELNSGRAIQSSNANIAEQPQSDEQIDTTIEDGEEEIVAEIPVIITGAYLSCQPLSEDDTALACKFAMEDKGVFEYLKVDEILEFMVDGIDPISFSIREINAEQGNIILSSSKSDIDLLRKKRRQKDKLVFEAIRRNTDSTQPPSTEAPAAESPSTEAPAAEPPAEAMVLSNINLVANGSFEADVIADGSIQKLGFENGLIDWERTLGITSEIHRNVNAWLAGDGSQWTELCSTGDSGIRQIIQTVPGRSYQLQFYFSPQPLVVEEYNQLHVKIAGNELFHESANGIDLTQTSWVLYTLDFTANDNSTEIEFFSSGCNDAQGNPVSNMGTFLDDVKVFEYIPDIPITD
ncbi:MAG: DUF642 domain-containing protein [Oligoflexales bacterium]